MATLIKNRARSFSAAGAIQVGFANIAMPGLPSKKHLSFAIGDFTMRASLEEVEKLKADIAKALAFAKEAGG